LTSPLQAVPEQAAIVVSLRLDRLRASALSRLIPDLSSPRSAEPNACSAALFERVQQLAVWMPLGSDHEFGIAALGDVPLDQFLPCARASIDARGGLVNVVQSESFTVVEDRALGEGAASLAMRQGGPLLVGRGQQLARMMASAAERAPSADSSGDHARMRRDLGEPGDVTLTAIMSEGLRKKVRELAGQDTPASQVTAVAASLQAGPKVQVRVGAWCESAGACSLLAQRIEGLLSEVRGSTSMRVAGVAGLLQNAVVHAQGSQLVFEAQAPADEFVAVVERVWRWDDLLGAGALPPMPPAPSLTLPNEVLRAPRDGGP
jgi:hypothetical protein